MALLMHHSSGTLVSGRVDASSKSAMIDPLSERSKSWSKNPVSAEAEEEASGLEASWCACVFGVVAGERCSSCEIGGGWARSSRLSFFAVMPKSQIAWP